MDEKKILIDEILKYTDYDARILIGLATVGVATGGQLIRLCHKLSDREEYLLHLERKQEEKYKAILSAADKLARFDGYVIKEMNVKLPDSMGIGTTTVWYLTAKGLAAVRAINSYFTRYSGMGLPCGAKKERIPHELAVTECFLKLTERQIVCDFIPERELKSRIVRRRYELRRQGINPNLSRELNGEETGDFRAVLMPKSLESSPSWEIEGEAAINYRGAQIAAKPDNMLWFVTSKKQKEMVIAVKKERVNAVWILDDVCKPLTVKVENKAVNTRKTSRPRHSNIERKIKDYLRFQKFAVTGRALAKILNENHGNVSRVLKRLIDQQIIEVDEIKLTPTRHVGRPHFLYWHSDNDDNISQKRADRVKYLVISETIRLLAERKYRFVQYTESVRQADFKPLDSANKANLIVVIESPEISRNQLRNKIENANLSLENPNIEVLISVSTQEKYDELGDIIQRNHALIIEKKAFFAPKNAAAAS